MIKLQNGTYILGFDDGYQMSKTANFVLENGVYEMGMVEPTLTENTLFYEGRYYKVGEGRSAITENKTSDEKARLLTMAAMAREFREEGVTRANVILAVGLPFSNYGREKQSLIDYYNMRKHLSFEYEKVQYDVTIERVICCPQCYAAIAPRLENMKEDYLIVDIGSKTTDIVFVKNGFPVESKSISIEKAMIKWMKDIQGKLQIQFGKDIPEEEIMKVILAKDSMLQPNCLRLIKSTLTEQVKSLQLELAEREYNLDYIKVIFVGGGAIVAQNYSEEYRSNYAYDCDLKANAIGYEFLAYNILQKGGSL